MFENLVGALLDQSPFGGGSTAKPVTPQAIERRRKVADALMQQATSAKPIDSPWQGVANITGALLAGAQSRKADQMEAEAQQASMDRWVKAFSGKDDQQTSPPPAVPPQSGEVAQPNYSNLMGAQNVDPRIKSGISETASALGVSPVDLATAISYETAGTFNPSKAGPTTQWGQHRGLIQFGEPQAQKYGVDWNNPISSQLGPDGAVAKYLRDTGVKPGMGLMDIYSAINAGGVGRYGASDAGNGGAPGTVADKVNNQMGRHRELASALMGGQQAGPTQIASADPNFNPRGGISVPGYEGKFTREQATDAEGFPSQSEWDAALKASSAPQQVTSSPPPPTAQVAPSGNRPDTKTLMSLALDPFASGVQRQIAGNMLVKSMSEGSYGAPYRDEFGNVVQRGSDGKISVINQARDKGETQPSSVQEYEYAKKNGFNGSFTDWKQQGGSAATTPSTVQEYNFYADQTRKTGQEPLSFFDYQKQKAARFANFDDSQNKDLVDSLATRLLKGDTTWKTGLARTPGLIQQVEAEAARRGKGAPSGNNADEILQNRANQVGRTQEQRTLGTASANNTMYGNIAAASMDTAVEASRAVPRGNWMPWNKLSQMAQDAISDPKLAAFRAATNTLVNEYAKATSPVGVPTDSQRNHAHEMLNTAQGPEAFEKVVQMLHREVANAHRGIQQTKEQLRGGEHSELPPLKTMEKPAATPKRYKYDASGNLVEK